MDNQAITVFAPAKINLFLGVHSEKDARGYHRVDSVMASLAIGDTVRIRPAQELSVNCEPAVGIPQEANTCWQAAMRLGEACGKKPAFSIQVSKHMPDRAGLGGSSSDAAATLVGLCRLWGIDPQSEEVYAVARAVGADVPFFLAGSPALLRGAGDELCEVLPALENMHLVLAKRADPGIGAREAYVDYDRSPTKAADPEPLCEAIRTHDAKTFTKTLSNNLEPVAFRLLPAVRDLRDWLAGLAGVQVAMVTGSGSCTFALCEDESAARAVAGEAREHGLWAEATTFIDHGAAVVEE